MFFDPPAVALRKMMPDPIKRSFDAVEGFARTSLIYSAPENQSYQIGIVLALWFKAGELQRKIGLSNRDSTKVQSIYESCVRTVGRASGQADLVLIELADQNGTFGVPSSLYRELYAKSLM